MVFITIPAFLFLNAFKPTYLNLFFCFYRCNSIYKNKGLHSNSWKVLNRSKGCYQKSILIGGSPISLLEILPEFNYNKLILFYENQNGYLTRKLIKEKKLTENNRLIWIISQAGYCCISWKNQQNNWELNKLWNYWYIHDWNKKWTFQKFCIIKV